MKGRERGDKDGEKGKEWRGRLTEHTRKEERMSQGKEVKRQEGGGDGMKMKKERRGDKERGMEWGGTWNRVVKQRGLKEMM